MKIRFVDGLNMISRDVLFSLLHADLGIAIVRVPNRQSPCYGCFVKGGPDFAPNLWEFSFSDGLYTTRKEALKRVGELFAQKVPLYTEEDRSYVAVKPCGCVVAACTADFAHADKSIADWIARGYEVKLVDHTYVKKRFTGIGCEHSSLPEEGQLSLFSV